MALTPLSTLQRKELIPMRKVSRDCYIKGKGRKKTTSKVNIKCIVMSVLHGRGIIWSRATMHMDIVRMPCVMSNTTIASTPVLQRSMRRRKRRAYLTKIHNVYLRMHYLLYPID